MDKLNVGDAVICKEYGFEPGKVVQITRNMLGMTIYIIKLDSSERYQPCFYRHELSKAIPLPV